MKAPHPHPDRATKALVTLVLSIFIMLVSTMLLYYNMTESNVIHDQALVLSMGISLVISAVIGSVLYATYIRKHKEEKVVDKNVS